MSILYSAVLYVLDPKIGICEWRTARRFSHTSVLCDAKESWDTLLKCMIVKLDGEVQSVHEDTNQQSGMWT